jgi:tetratricopeptide (TPR) repeat protein
MGTRALLAAALLVLLSSPAGAADEADVKRARELNRAGQKHYNLGEFKEAIEYFKKAYKLVERPELLFNIAQAYRISKNFGKALFFYRAFLRKRPDARVRPEVERRIAEMEASLKRRDKTSESPPTGSVDAFQGGDRAGSTPRAGSAPRTDLVKAPSDNDTPPPAAGRPIYKRWWFWTGIAVLVAAGTSIAVVAATRGGADAPDTHFPTRPLF